MGDPVIRPPREELPALTGIRALAAGWVVVEHFRLVLYGLFPGVEAVLGPWIRSGFLGVEVFFVLSGFIIAYTYADRLGVPTWRAYRTFLELRVARIYPVHVVTLVAMLVLVIGAGAAGVELSAPGSYTPASFLGNLLGLQAFDAVPAWNVPAWSISAEFAAYLCFPFVAILLLRLRTAMSGFSVAAILVVTGVAAMLLVGELVDASPTGGLMVWIRIAFEFTAGCCLYAGWRWLGDRRIGAGWDVVAVLSVAGVFAVLAVTGGEGSRALVTFPLIALFVLACAGADGPVGRILGSRVLRWGGRVSYSVYMTHFIVLMVLGVLLPVEGFAGAGAGTRLGILALYYAAAVAAGAVCYHAVEEPARRWIRDRLRGGRASSDATT